LQLEYHEQRVEQLDHLVERLVEQHHQRCWIRQFDDRS
jgi:hypothetical protein